MITVLLDCRMACWSGVGRYTHGLVRALAAREDLSLVLATVPGAAPIAPDSAHVRSVDAARHPFSALGMRELAAIARDQKPELVHCLHFPTPWPSEAPLVVTLHDLTPLLVPTSMPSRVKRATYRRLNRRAVRLATRISVPSGATASDVTRLFPGARDKTAVIPAASDDFANGDVGEVPKALALGDAPYVLTMGNTKPHKDLPTLLAAFQQLANEHPHLRLVLVGEEPPGYLDGLLPGEPRARALFTGPVTDAELRALYSRATVFAFPSRYEGFGLPPLEAMSFGTPVIAARAASIPEVVGDAAVLFPPGDAGALAAGLGTVLTDAELREDLARKGQERAAEFSWTASAEKTAALYTDALSATASATAPG